MKEKLLVGQKVLLRNTRQNTFVEQVISKVARKYFWLETVGDTRFNIETGECSESRFWSRFKVYFSHEEFAEEERLKQE
jgi:hypothetical protein